MRKACFIFSYFLCLLINAQVREAICPQTSYHCLKPDGTEMAGGLVGPINMWYDPVKQNCVPSAHSYVDGCTQIARLCNQKYPLECGNDCLPGKGLSYELERSCEGVHPMSPPTTLPQPDAHYEIRYSQPYDYFRDRGIDQ